VIGPFFAAPQHARPPPLAGLAEVDETEILSIIAGQRERLYFLLRYFVLPDAEGQALTDDGYASNLVCGAN
jgi:hypothetical protein